MPVYYHLSPPFSKAQYAVLYKTSSLLANTGNAAANPLPGLCPVSRHPEMPTGAFAPCTTNGAPPTPPRPTPAAAPDVALAGSSDLQRLPSSELCQPRLLRSAAQHLTPPVLPCAPPGLCQSTLSCVSAAATAVGASGGGVSPLTSPSGGRGHSRDMLCRPLGCISADIQQSLHSLPLLCVHVLRPGGGATRQPEERMVTATVERAERDREGQGQGRADSDKDRCLCDFASLHLHNCGRDGSLRRSRLRSCLERASLHSTR